MMWNVQIKLERLNHLKEEDESFFDKNILNLKL
jgi:hypothetical protein